MVSQSDNLKIKDIILKIPSEELNNYDKEEDLNQWKIEK